MFKAEGQLYKDQGVDVDVKTLMGGFSDNQQIVELISGTGGIFSILADIVLTGNRKVNRTDDETDRDLPILTKIRNKFFVFPNNHPNCVVTSRTQEPAEWERCFSVVHFAGEIVNYNITGFRQKNEDKVPKKVDSLLRDKTSNSFLKVQCMPR